MTTSHPEGRIHNDVEKRPFFGGWVGKSSQGGAARSNLRKNKNNRTKPSNHPPSGYIASLSNEAYCKFARKRRKSKVRVCGIRRDMRMRKMGSMLNFPQTAEERPRDFHAGKSTLENLRIWNRPKVHPNCTKCAFLVWKPAQRQGRGRNANQQCSRRRTASKVIVWRF